MFGPDGETLYSNPALAGSIREAVTRTPSGETVIVSTSADLLDENFRSQLQVLLLLALGVIAAAAGLAAVQAHQLARPLERLSRRAGAIGDGDFSLGPFVRTRIPEIDGIGSALETSSQRVHTMLANERHFTADATHQLRTGIAGIAMRVEIMSMSTDPERRLRGAHDPDANRPAQRDDRRVAGCSSQPVHERAGRLRSDRSRRSTMSRSGSRGMRPLGVTSGWS